MEVETITESLKYWSTWEGLQKIFDTTEVEVMCSFYELRYLKGDRLCWTIEWTSK